MSVCGNGLNCSLFVQYFDTDSWFERETVLYCLGYVLEIDQSISPGSSITVSKQWVKGEELLATEEQSTTSTKPEIVETDGTPESEFMTTQTSQEQKL